uniref:Putative secreted protein n=1 Tax=Ixodes ricinus TaxID=34613 RepID=A0A6B0UBV7_IXORI
MAMFFVLFFNLAFFFIIHKECSLCCALTCYHDFVFLVLALPMYNRPTASCAIGQKCSFPPGNSIYREGFHVLFVLGIGSNSHFYYLSSKCLLKVLGPSYQQHYRGK